MKIGFIGYGEAAYNISLGLGKEGLTGICATDAMMDHPVMGAQVHSRAQQAGVTLLPTNQEVAQWADVLFAAVPSSFTMDVCNDIKSVLRPGQRVHACRQGGDLGGRVRHRRSLCGRGYAGLSAQG